MRCWIISSFVIFAVFDVRVNKCINWCFVHLFFSWATQLELSSTEPWSVVAVAESQTKVFIRGVIWGQAGGSRNPPPHFQKNDFIFFCKSYLWNSISAARTKRYVRLRCQWFTEITPLVFITSLRVWSLISFLDGFCRTNRQPLLYPFEFKVHRQRQKLCSCITNCSIIRTLKCSRQKSLYFRTSFNATNSVAKDTSPSGLPRLLYKIKVRRTTNFQQW